MMRAIVPSVLVLLIASATRAEPCPPTIVIDYDWLTQTRDRVLANDPTIMSAHNLLLQKANSALTRGPWAVTDDPENIPPSGNLNDFLQVGPYVWPDPDNPGQWIIIDGVTNPDNAMDAATHWSMSKNTYRLAMAYFFTGNEQYAEIAARNLRVWYVDPPTAMTPRIVMLVPPYPPTMVAPGAAERICMDFDAVRLLAPSPHWTEADQAVFEQWVADYIVWIDTAEEPIDERLSDNNHGIWFDVHPVACRLFLDRVAEAHAILATVGPHRIAVQMEPDGTLPAEMVRADSLHYHEYVARGLEMLADMSRLSGGPDIWNYVGPDGESIALLLDFMEPYSTGTPWPYFPGAPFTLAHFNHILMFTRPALALWEPSYHAVADQITGSAAVWDFDSWYAAPNVIGDLDGDWRVHFSDLTALLAAWGACPGCDADIDDDGAVGFTDLSELLARFEP